MAKSKKHVAVYVRVSGDSQNHKSQLPDLKRWAESQDHPIKWYSDTFTGKTMARPGWQKLEAAMRSGQVSKLVVWRQDRLGRTTREMLALRDELIARKVDLVCIMAGVMGLDTPEGRFMFSIMAAQAEYDNEVRSERIRAGQAAARAEGRKWGGSKKGVRKKVTATQAKAIRRMREEGETVNAIALAVGLSRPTIYSVLAEQVSDGES